MSQDDIIFITNPKSKLHYQPFPRPHLEAFETPLRIQMAEHHLSKSGVLKEDIHVKAPSAKLDDVLLVHSPYLVETVRLMSDLGSGDLGESAYASPDLLRSALVTVGGAMKSADLVCSETVNHAFVLMRPPGHHATTSNAMGLCYFNNIAIATRHAMRQHKINKVTILDFDDHHGNGTSEIFYTDPKVQYISIHEYDYQNFGLGHFEELGYGEGVGKNINIPLVDTSSDRSYESAINEIVIPAINRFNPELIAVSAGYDAHYSDPVGNMDVDSRTFWKFGKTVSEMVRAVGAKGSLWVLEGGYNPFAIGPSIEASIIGLQEKPLPKMEDQKKRQIHEQLIEINSEVIEKVLETIKPHW